MKNDIYALLYKKGTETGKSYAEAADKKRKTLTKLGLIIGLPLLVFIGYQYIPPKLSREVTAADLAAIAKEASEKKLETVFANTGLYRGNKDLTRLAAAMQAEQGKTGPVDVEQIKALVKNGADVLAYHSVGRVVDGKVVPYDSSNSPAVRAAIRNPAEFSDDLDRSFKKGNGTIVALIGSGRELYNVLPDGSMDPACAAGLLESFSKAQPGYADKLKVIFFHPYSQDSLFGQPEYEADKFARIAALGWKNAFLGINLGKDDLAKPLLTENGWQGREFWPEGPGITNFQDTQILLDKRLTAARLRSIDGSLVLSDFYWLPWGTVPKDAKAAAELTRNYSLLFAGYSGDKPAAGDPAIIPAKVMGGK